VIEKYAKFTPEEIRQAFLTPCNTDRELKRFIKYFFELDLPDVVVSRFADMSPFHAIWEPYNICVNKNNPKNITEYLYIAGRGTGKCTKKGTKILTKEGLKKIEDIQLGDLVYTGWSYQKVKEVFDEGIKKSITISTSTNEITGSLKHRIQVLQKNGNIDWEYLTNLSPERYVYKSSILETDISPIYPIDIISVYFRYFWTNTYIYDKFHELSENGFIKRQFLEILRDFFFEKKNEEYVKNIDFILNGYFEKIECIKYGEDYFYDLEVEKDHSYWSNGFISHNTLSMAVAELLMVFHDQRDAVHVGGILSQAKRCYAYQKKFLLSDKIKPIVHPPEMNADERIVQSTTMEKTSFLVNKEHITIEVLPCTLKACPDPESIVVCNGKEIPIKDVKAGDKLKSINIETLKDAEVVVLNTEIKKKDGYRVVFDDGTELVASSSHEVLTQNGWMEIRFLQPGINVVSSDMKNWNRSENYKWTPPELDINEIKSVMIGMMLGDGHLQKSPYLNGNPRFYVAHSEDQKEYLDYCNQYIEKIVEIKRVREKTSGYGSKMFETITGSQPSLRFLQDLFLNEQGKKVIKPELIECLDHIAVAFWYMDDGFLQDSRCGFSTCSFNEEELQILIKALNRLGYPNVFIHRKNQLRLDKEGSRRLMENIAKYVHPNVSYKIFKNKIPYCKMPIDGRQYVEEIQNKKKPYINKGVNEQWDIDFKNIKIKQVSHKEFVFNIDVVEIEVASEDIKNNYGNFNFMCNLSYSHNCNGPHVPFVVCDEIDTVTGEGIVAYKEISGMLDPRKGKQPLRIGISSLKSRNGLVAKTIEQAVVQDVTIKKWTVFEFTERCSDERSGTIPTTYYVNTMGWDVVQADVFETSTIPNKTSYTLEKNMFDKCGGCKIAPICMGDAKNQTCKSNMLKPISSVIKTVNKEGVDWSLAQLMSLKPESKGAVFPRFERKSHVKNWNQMWYLLTGFNYPGQCTHDSFVAKCLSMKLASYGAIDWGWSNPSTLVVAFIDKNETVFIVGAYGQTYTTKAEWRSIIKYKYHPKYRTSLYFPDVADPGIVKEMNEEGLTVGNISVCKAEKSVGVDLIAKFLKMPGIADPKIYFAEETCDFKIGGHPGLVEEMEKYSYKSGPDGELTDKFEDKDDHYIDALRYLMTGVFSTTSAHLCGSDADIYEGLLNERGEIIKRNLSSNDFDILTGKNIIMNKGINEGIRKGSLNELLEQEEKSEIQGEGGFFFSF
jgi:hypothetical protein